MKIFILADPGNAESVCEFDEIHDAYASREAAEAALAEDERYYPLRDSMVVVERTLHGDLGGMASWLTMEAKLTEHGSQVERSESIEDRVRLFDDPPIGVAVEGHPEWKILPERTSHVIVAVWGVDHLAVRERFEVEVARAAKSYTDLVTD